MERTIDSVVEVLRHRHDVDRKCSLLIGAGCSVAAGIPTAAGFVEIIKERFGSAYGAASEKTYPTCMAQLPRGIQRDLIAEKVDTARINWAHIAIAQLLKNGYVDRVLTTNFDPLVMRACAMVGEYPAVYDFAASQMFKPDHVPQKAVFHLHGQRDGFALMNTQKQVAEHAERLGPLFADAGRGRSWIVVGYSGDNDPVFDHLATVAEFDFGLYWIGYKDNEPAKHVRDRLLTGSKGVYYVRGFDADRFFVELAQRLDCFPPNLVERPFTHLEHALEDLVPFPLPFGDREIDFLQKPRDLIRRAIETLEETATEGAAEAGATLASNDLAAGALFMAGKYDDLEALGEGREGDSPLFREVMAWSRFLQGNALADKAETNPTADEADRLFQLASEKYEGALAIKPDLCEALNNWGNALATQAKTKADDDADRLFQLAAKKYEAALATKPDSHDALNNWGAALQAQAKAKAKAGDDADRLFQLASEKYEAALAIKPDRHQALYNLGNALADQAETKTGGEADRLFHLATEKYEAAFNIKPDYHQALNNWGAALVRQAKTKTGEPEKADELFRLAGEKYEAALAIKPDAHEILYNWGSALAIQAETKDGEEVHRLFQLAAEKFEAALASKPDSVEALSNWGNALANQAKTKTGDRADRLFQLAAKKFEAAVATKPDYQEGLSNWGAALLNQARTKGKEQRAHLLDRAEEKLREAEGLDPKGALYNLACLHALRGNEDAARESLLAAQVHGVLPPHDHIKADPDFEGLRERTWFKAFLANFDNGSRTAAV